MAQQILSTNTFTAATWIVNSNARKGTHTTLAGAMASASSGDTILLQTSVTENVTLTPGVNIMGYAGAQSGTPNVSITGKLTMTGAGACVISNIQLITNSDYFLVVSGSANNIVDLFNCNLNCLNNTGISYTSSGASSGINAYNCNGNIGTTGITYFVNSGANGIVFQNCDLENSGLSTTASTASAGVIVAQFCKFIFPITTTSTGVIQLTNCQMGPAVGTNVTMVTHGGSAANSVISNCYIASGTSSAVSIGSTLTMANTTILSSNTNAITGAGTLINGGISFIGTSYKINTTTQTVAEFDVGGISFDGGTNLLQYYVQGTWTPTIFGASTAGSTSYGAQAGAYTRIGNQITLWCVVTASSATGTGDINFGGLPFTIHNATADNAFGGLVTLGLTFPVTYTNPNISGTADTSFLFIECYKTASASSSNMQMVNTPQNHQFTISHQI